MKAPRLRAAACLLAWPFPFPVWCVCFVSSRFCVRVCVGVCLFWIALFVFFTKIAGAQRCLCGCVCSFLRADRQLPQKKKKRRYKLCTHHVLVASVVLVVFLEFMADEGGEEQPEEEVASLVCVRLKVNDNDRVYVKSSWRKTSFGIVVLNNQSGEAWSCDGA